MKILITGGSGFVGGFFNRNLKGFEIFAPKKSEVDFTNPQHVNNVFKFYGNFDVVLHCAIKGGSRLREDGWEILDDNLKMYYNILNNQSSFTKFITFGSGAEIYAQEQPYGLSKKVIYKSVSSRDNFYSIRIFGLFGEGELDTRFIKSALTNYANKKPIEIYENKYMDFFYVEDLLKVTTHYIKNDNLPKFIDCSYGKQKLSLLDIADKINLLDDHRVDIIFKNKESTVKDYVGNESLLLSIPLQLTGFDEALKLEYQRIKSGL